MRPRHAYDKVFEKSQAPSGGWAVIMCPSRIVHSMKHNIRAESSCGFADLMLKNMSFKVGQTLTVTGVPKADATKFSINVGHSEGELALHMNPRFEANRDHRILALNSYQGGKWGEHVAYGVFPFNQGEEFKVKITFTSEEFHITLPDGSEIRFPNRFHAEKYRYLLFDGEAKIQGIEIK
ncbi:beta-galactoside-binding lectin-like [Chanos chanos]|uniref:Galectin n=1 Tax=Chanos chanos TaxID=29144 RepID=A0A6J2W3P5_CHACN|nr:beta-galactoside-binding lectin-like [Chanos chanos]